MPTDLESTVIPHNLQRDGVDDNLCPGDRILSFCAVDRSDRSGGVMVEDLSSRRQDWCTSRWDDDDVDMLVSKSSIKGLVRAGDDFYASDEEVARYSGSRVIPKLGEQ